MSQPIFIALTVEGTTDTRFLESILESVFQELALNHLDADVECEVSVLGRYDKSEGFCSGVIKASKMSRSESLWADTLAVHTDADKMTYDERRNTNFDSVFEKLKNVNPEEYCTVITPIIPVRMIEAWMLADCDLLRQEIGTSLTKAQLGIDGNPESFADPKSKVEDAIRIAEESATHKRPTNKISIGELYQIIGKKISLERLEQLSSFQRFEQEVLNTFKEIGLRVH